MEQKRTHWRTLVNPDYIGAYCIDKDTIVKIISVARQIVKGEAGKQEECTVAQLQGLKPFIINRTNAKTITKVLGTPYIEEWAGKSITIYPTTTSVKGDMVECLRVRPIAPKLTLPELKEGTEAWTKVVAYMKEEGAKIEEVKKKYLVSEELIKKLVK